MDLFGRAPHADPEIKPPSYSGDSIGHFEGDTLVVETTNLRPKHHWVQPGIPISSQFKIVERIKLKDDGKIMEDTFTMTGPVNWEGEWVNTKVWYRYDNSDIEEAYCLPDLNDRQVVDNQRVLDMPLNGRNPVELVFLAGMANYPASAP